MSPEKPRSLRFFARLPITRDAGDPEYAGVLLLFALIVGGGLLFLGGTSDAYGHVLQTAGGALVLLGLYFTGINLRWTRYEQYAGRLGRREWLRCIAASSYFARALGGSGQAANPVLHLDRLLEHLMEPIGRKGRRRAAEAIRQVDR
jgi:hypothetical protein